MGDRLVGQQDDWSMSAERAFMENLLCARFNFFLVVFAGVLAGGFAAQQTFQQLFAFGSGFVVSFLIMLTLYRAQHKLDIIIRRLKGIGDHPVAIVDKAAGGIPMRGLIGYGIPTVCCLALAFATHLSYRDWISSGGVITFGKPTTTQPATGSPQNQQVQPPTGGTSKATP